MEINVVYQFNEKYVPYAGVSMTSLLLNNAGTVNIYALVEDVSSESKDLLTSAVEKLGGHISFPDTAPLIAKIKELGLMPYRGAYSVYLRLFFHELLPPSAGRVIYLDADTIVDSDLACLVGYDLGGRVLGMVLESITDDYKVMTGLARSDEYYNSGVILFDADAWRCGGFCDRIVEHIRNVRSTYIGDQDFLNIVFKGEICRLPLTYNFQPLHGRYTERQYFACYGQPPYYSLSEVCDAMESPVIYHCYRWLGEFPWNEGNLHPFNDVFDKYLLRSAWSGLRKEKVESGIVIRAEKILYRILPRVVFIRIFRMAHEMMLRRAENDARNMKTNKSA